MSPELWIGLLDFSAATGILFGLYFLWALRGAYIPRFLEDVSFEDLPLPPLTAIIPARNEENRIGETVRSLLAQTVPFLQVIAVDDRSMDRTGAILDEISREDDRLEAIHLDYLPTGWLGKLYALQTGLERAHGRWMLFTDGDVIFAPDALRRAVLHAERTRADHLAVFPHLDLRGLGEHALVSTFGLLFSVRQELGGVGDPRSGAHVGVGAFNLVRREVMEAIGGLKSLRLEITEDVELGRRIKRHGFRQTYLYSRAAVGLRWQVGLSGIIEGLTKNAFAASRFRVGRTLIEVLTLLLTNVLAPLAILLPTGWARLCSGLLWILLFTSYAIHRRVNGTPAWTAVFHPVGALILAYIVLRSMFLTLRRGGVVWRDTFYPIETLRSANLQDPDSLR